MTERPEREMVRRALAPGAIGIGVAAVLGSLLGGAGAAASAAIGIAVVIVNFAAHGLALAWASRISVALVPVVELAGFVLRLGVIVALLFALDGLSWFSALAFALAVVPGTLLLLAYEARLVLRGVGAGLEVPAEPAAQRAADALAARELVG